MKTAAQSVTWYSNLLKTLLGFFFFFLLRDFILLWSNTWQPFSSNFAWFPYWRSIKHKIPRNESDSVCFAIFSSTNTLTSAPKYRKISYYFSVFSFPHRKFKAFICFHICYTFGSNISWICRREQWTTIFWSVFGDEHSGTSTYLVMHLNSLHEQLRINKVSSTMSGVKKYTNQVNVC